MSGDRYRQRGLLGRLAAARRNVDLVESVTEHLRDLLNTTQGDCLTVNDYGLADISGAGASSEAVSRRVERAIQEAVRQYEPRVRQVVVRSLPPDPRDVGTLRFEVMAELVERQGELVRIQTRVLPTGQFEVQG